MAKKKQNIEENNKAVTNRDQLSELVANCDQFVVNEPTFSQSDIEKIIVTVRGVQLMIDCDLAHVYSVTTSQLNQQVKRNIARFPNNFRAVRLHDVGAGPVPARCPHKGHIHLPLSPTTFALKGNRAGTGSLPLHWQISSAQHDNFRFQLTEAERDEVVTNCDNLCSLKFNPTLPYAFTEPGIADDRVLSLLMKRGEGITAPIHSCFTKDFLTDWEKHNKLGASVKDLGSGLCAVTKLRVTPETVLGLFK